MLIDCHAHLHVDAFDTDRQSVIERAYAAGITTIINVGFDVEGNFKSLQLAKQHDFIFATMGVHPHLASEWNESVSQGIYDTCKHELKVIALGEMGLDYYKNFQPRDLQITVFRAQLTLAEKLQLPVIIHCRDAFEDVYNILLDYSLPNVLLHCFTGTHAQAVVAWQRGYYTAFTGIVTYPSAHELRGVARACPIDKIILETDCPYLSPQAHRGKRNEPAFLQETAHYLSTLRGELFDDFTLAIKQNATTLFFSGR